MSFDLDSFEARMKMPYAITRTAEYRCLFFQSVALMANEDLLYIIFPTWLSDPPPFFLKCVANKFLITKCRGCRLTFRQI